MANTLGRGTSQQNRQAARHELEVDPYMQDSSATRTPTTVREAAE